MASNTMYHSDISVSPKGTEAEALYRLPVYSDREIPKGAPNNTQFSANKSPYLRNGAR